MRDTVKPTNTPAEFTQGNNIPAENTPRIGPLTTPPIIMAASIMPGRNLIRKVRL